MYNPLYNKRFDDGIERVDAVTIKVETVIRTGYYNKQNNTFNDGYTYVVRQEDVAAALLLIVQEHAKYALPCKRVYPTQWKTVSKGEILTLEKIVKQIEELAEKKGAITPQKIKIKTK